MEGWRPDDPDLLPAITNHPTFIRTSSASLTPVLAMTRMPPHVGRSVYELIFKKKEKRFEQQAVVVKQLAGNWLVRNQADCPTNCL